MLLSCKHIKTVRVNVIDLANINNSQNWEAPCKYEEDRTKPEGSNICTRPSIHPIPSILQLM